jgi:hypothetical protein
MLDVCLVQRVIGVAGLAQRRVENFLLDLGMDTQRPGRVLRDILHSVQVLVLLELLEVLKQLLHFGVIGLQQVERRLRTRRGTRRATGSPWHSHLHVGKLGHSDRAGHGVHVGPVSPYADVRRFGTRFKSDTV